MTTHTILAELDVEALGAILTTIKTLGPSGAFIAVLAYTVRKIVIWATPHAERMIAAYVKRQETMEECQRKLTDSTVEIQRESLSVVMQIRDRIPHICAAKSFPCHFQTLQDEEGNAHGS